MVKKIGKASWRLVTAACLLAAGVGFGSAQAQSGGDDNVYVPLIAAGKGPEPVPPVETGIPLVHLPRFEAEIRKPETAIFWFGEVTPSENYADIRMGYNSQELFVSLEIFDRLLWYDKTPEKNDLTPWDAVSLYLILPGEREVRYRFDGQLTWWEDRAPYYAAFRYTPQGWAQEDINFISRTDWRGNTPNNDLPDRGWIANFRIPFASLGLAGEPPEGTVWRAGLILNDRDSLDDLNPPKAWPTGFDPKTTQTWAELSFGIPTYIPPSIAPAGKIVIRHKLEGQDVPDGEVGGGNNCSENREFWTVWGSVPTPGGPQNSNFNIQNEADVSDWPCFAKAYITFPLDTVPAGAQIISAHMILHLMGNAGYTNEAKPSLIQVFTTHKPWSEATLTWNNAPQAMENIAASWVNPITNWPGWPGVPYTWDVSQAVIEHVQLRRPLSLAIYEADTDYHSGKYFVSAETGDWNEVARPTLEIVYGFPGQ